MSSCARLRQRQGLRVYPTTQQPSDLEFPAEICERVAFARGCPKLGWLSRNRPGGLAWQLRFHPQIEQNTVVTADRDWLFACPLEGCVSRLGCLPGWHRGRS